MDCASSQKVSRLVGISMLQKEVLAFRKAGHEKDKSLKDKDDAIEMLAKKVETLTKEMEVEAKKMRREVATMEKEVAAMQVDKEHKNKSKRLGNSKSSLICSQMLPGRYVLKSIYKLDVRLYKGLLSVTQDSDKDMNEGGRLRPWEELERSKQQSFSRIGNVTVSGITVVYPYLQSIGARTESLLLNDMVSLGNLNGQMRIVDSTVLASCSQESLSRVISLMINCISPDSSTRPSFEDILWNLQYAEQVQATSNVDPRMGRPKISPTGQYHRSFCYTFSG